MDVYTVFIIASHLTSLYLFTKFRHRFTFLVNLSKIFRVYSDFIMTQSVLWSWVKNQYQFDKKEIFKDNPTLYSDGQIVLNPIYNKTFSLQQTESEVQRYLSTFDRVVDNIDFIGVLMVSSIIFPVLLGFISVIILGTIILIVVPLIQTMLVWVLFRWVKTKI